MSHGGRGVAWRSAAKLVPEERDLRIAIEIVTAPSDYRIHVVCLAEAARMGAQFRLGLV